MANFFNGYLAQGVGTGASFVENSAVGYARQAAVLVPIFAGATSLATGLTHPALPSAVTVTQRGIYDAPSGGNLLLWWQQGAALAAGATDTLANLYLLFPDLAYVQGSGIVQWLPGTVVAVTGSGKSVFAGVGLAYAAGVLEASSTAGLNGGGGGGVTSLTGDVIGSGSGSVTTTLKAVGIAGIYGGGSAIPVITTDANGRVITVTTAAVQSIVPATAYTAAGPISPTAGSAVCGLPTAGNMTLANGGTLPLQLRIFNVGVGVVTLVPSGTTFMAGAQVNLTLQGSGTGGSAVCAEWQPAVSGGTWLFS